jgi:hypothetical protein
MTCLRLLSELRIHNLLQLLVFSLLTLSGIATTAEQTYVSEYTTRPEVFKVSL